MDYQKIEALLTVGIPIFWALMIVVGVYCAKGVRNS